MELPLPYEALLNDNSHSLVKADSGTPDIALLFVYVFAYTLASYMVYEQVCLRVRYTASESDIWCVYMCLQEAIDALCACVCQKCKRDL